MNIKIKPIAQLKKITDRAKKNKKIIVFTNGCFDIIHYGHVQYLQKAKAKGDILIIGLNADKSVRRLKGKNRPINCQKDRAGILAAFECVDYIVIFNEDTPFNVIKILKPNVLIKGADWSNKTIIGADIVTSCGGKVLTIPYLKNRSTSHIIEKIAT
ncbi:MAG: D-glycero-beta-D-manno-heptose 1-phosphate adenylyltransferase [Candidatus Omnitrophota bacterium]